jgi:hypothetical protein
VWNAKGMPELQKPGTKPESHQNWPEQDLKKAGQKRASQLFTGSLQSSVPQTPMAELRSMNP